MNRLTRPLTLKSVAEVDRMREAALVAAAVLDEVVARCLPGVTTWELAEVAERFMKRGNATSAFLGHAPPRTPPYPSVLCTSVNEVVVHGIPRKDVTLRDGDVIAVDFACFKEGFCADAARTVPVGAVSVQARALLDATKKALEAAIAMCTESHRLQDIGHAVQSFIEPLGYSMSRELAGHGIGRAMHEAPRVPNHGRLGCGIRLRPGMVLALEPMVNAGRPEVEVLGDGWTVVTSDRQISAHFEHTVAITNGPPMVLTRRS